MNRRHFLILTLTSLAGLAATRLPGILAAATPAFQFKGKFYKGAASSQIFESADGRSAWTQVAEFGQPCQVRRIAERSGKLIAEIGLGRYSFNLESQDGRVWYSRSFSQVTA